MFWFRKKKMPKFDYFDEMEIAQEFGFDPFSETPHSLSHTGRQEWQATAKEMEQTEENEQISEEERENRI